MKNLVCEKDKCCGCSACKDVCPKAAIDIRDNLLYFEAVINEERCIDCNRCKDVCPNITKPEFLQPKKWYQGWAKDTQIRRESSSGGFARVVSEYFVQNEGYVCSCIFEGGEFKFQLASSIDEVAKFTGSKYVKSNPDGCYRQIQQKLKENKNVLFIGLPCQVASLKNYVGKNGLENLYTIDLICHGTPSVKVLELFLKEHELSLKDINTISFRQKNKFAVDGEKRFTPYGVMDRYTVAFLTGSCYTQNCYQCLFAKKERVSDITIGDSWGSDLTDEENKGISLLLCQTNKGISLLENLDFEYKPVDLDKAIAANHQLSAPSKRPEFLEAFYQELMEGKKFSSVVFKYCRIKCLKQIIKQILVKLHLKNFQGGVWDTE